MHQHHCMLKFIFLEFSHNTQQFYANLTNTSWAVLVSNSLFGWSLLRSYRWVTLLGIVDDHPKDGG